jgi:hypothetical protein
MTQELDQSIKFAAKQDYKQFEKTISDKMTDKMKDKLSGFMNHLEKSMFKEE